MKKSFFSLTLFLLIIISLFTGCEKTSTENPWYTSWKEASSKADETNKNIFIFFSNINSDEKSREINEYFSRPKFAKKIAKNYVLLNIDINSNQNEMEYADLIAAYELAKKFSIQALPAIILATPEGYVIGSVVHHDMQQSAEKIFNQVLSFSGKAKNVTKIRNELEKITEDEKRVFAIDELLSNLDVSYRYLVIELLAEIKEKDPENELGLYNKHLMSFAYVDALSVFESGDAQGAIDVFLKVAESGNISSADVQECYQTVAYLLAQTGIGSPEVVIDYLNKAIQADPKSKEVEAIQQTIDYLNELISSSESE